ncbi:hypothetical protein K437DRAFT_233479 [Tilletiaria anomala UBC 951]|uniref:CREG-like beta-barrel domain-containing protein n=1 Tax=Tilletiaria anomala (strain ATCC 24038 / CBS 436.72 / UBC 951) TaxID=1037660 RepID=A0A066WEB2_TILAU|nr:uncharacterized protein K437DRAFT_233479 [Tilletiaria anomala UBC 951]KDN50843.1 hypothetical protein K437DRAFT_233479 [Tilletiaria anomala UBC 951]
MKLYSAIAVSLLVSLAQAAAGWETVDDAAVQAAQKLFEESIFGVGTFASKYPSNHPVPELRDQVVASPDYFAPCFLNGDLLMLAMPVSQHWRNALTSPHRNATFSIGSNPDPSIPDPRHVKSFHSRVAPNLLKGHKPPHWDPSRPNWRRFMPSKNRMTLFGHIVQVPSLSSAISPVVSSQHDEAHSLAQCFLSYHPDSAHWAPGSTESPHTAFWARFVVDRVYHVGGFGDEHFIGFIPLEKYREAVGAQYREASTTVAFIAENRVAKAVHIEALFASWSGDENPSLILQG